MVSYVIMVSYIIIIGHHGLLGKYTQYQHVRRWVCPWVSPVQRAGVTSWEGQREEEVKRQCISGLKPLKIPPSELCDEWFQLLLHHTTTHPSIHPFPTRPTTYSPCHRNSNCSESDWLILFLKNSEFEEKCIVFNYGIYHKCFLY